MTECRPLAEHHVSFLLGTTVRRTCRNRNAVLRQTDRTVGFCFEVRGPRLELSGRTARADRSQRLAQANSIAKMANPSGITISAGPGSTINAKPMTSTVPPRIATTTRLTCFIAALPRGGFPAL